MGWDMSTVCKLNTWAAQLIQKCGVNKHVFPNSGGLWRMVSGETGWIVTGK